MHVSIQHRETVRGVWKRIRQVQVIVRVRFSEAEKAVIARRQLRDFIVIKRHPDSLTVRRLEMLGLKPDSDSRDLLVTDLMHGRAARFVCDTPVHAKAYERALAEALKSLKLFIADSEVVGRTRVFDL
jgi:hypothetical protein